MSARGQRSGGRTIRRVLRYIGDYRASLILSLVLSVVTVGCALYIPKQSGEVVDFMLGPGKVNFSAVFATCVRIGIAAVILAVSQWLVSVLNNRMTWGVVERLRKDAFERIEKLPLSYIDAHPAGDIISRVVADVDTFADGLLMGFTQFFTGVCTILGTFLFMLSVNGWITLIVVGLTPLSFVAAFVISRATARMFAEQAQVRGEQTGFIDEKINAQRVVTAFGRQRAEEETFAEMNERLRRCSLKATFYSSLTNPTTRFINALIYMGIGVGGAFFALRGVITVGKLAAFLSYASQYTKPFNEISGVVTELQNAIACAGRIFELIDEEPETPDAESAAASAAFRGDILLDDVAFSYNKERRLIEHLNLHVEPGQRIAIVGPTGSGKTTLVNLLMRFYDTDAGEIRIDGIPIRDMRRRVLRDGFGMVLQETWLKTGTIRDNIAMGILSEEIDARVRAAAETCHVDDFVRRLPEGYDTMVSDESDGLSQGQRQLLCIARVMASDPAMLILDEATSSIDTRTELKIQDAFEKLMSGRTSFIVAHRLSTIRNADRILVMKDGRVIEQGTHDELIAAGGFYKTLYHSQFAGEAI
ncbi:MAG: ABC transporter ATP-binding protein/permease [Lachnospiraceae bacterium]|nr:ABC transporter ATP-binding protein/permease [Lachnospiraceae bacterium]